MTNILIILLVAILICYIAIGYKMGRNQAISEFRARIKESRMNKKNRLNKK